MSSQVQENMTRRPGFRVTKSPADPIYCPSPWTDLASGPFDVAGEKGGKGWCNAGASRSLRVAEFPRRVPTAAFHTPAPLKGAGHPSKLPPEEHNRCVDAPCASITHCLSSHSLRTVCGPMRRKAKWCNEWEQTTTTSYFVNYLCAIYGNGNFIYTAHFITSELNVLFIGRQHVKPWAE